MKVKQLNAGYLAHNNTLAPLYKTVSDTRQFKSRVERKTSVSQTVVFPQT